MSMAVWLCRWAMPLALALLRITVSTSGRTGMNCRVKARPTSFLSGCTMWKPSAYWLRKPLRGSTAQTSSEDISRARSRMESGTFGRPSGKRSKGFWEVYSINSSRLMVNNWACPSGASSAARQPPASVSPNLRIMVICLSSKKYSTPQPVVGAVLVPLRGGLEPARLRQVLLHGFLVQGHTQARLVGHGDEAVVDDGLLHPFHQVVPEGHIHGVIFQHQEIFGRGGAVHVGERADGGAGVMHGHGYAELLRGVTDLLGFQNSAGGG